MSVPDVSAHQTDIHEDGQIPSTRSDTSCEAECSMRQSQLSEDFQVEDSINLLDLPWEQVLCSHMLTHLGSADLFRLRAVSSGCKELVRTYFRLQFHVNTNTLGDHFTSHAFHIMTRECTSLKSLSVRGAKSWLTTDVLLDVICANPRLEKIDLTGCIALSGAVLYSIGVNCNSIRHLCLKDCVWLSVDNFLSFLCNKRDLEYLDISGCWNLDDDLVIQLVQISPR